MQALLCDICEQPIRGKAFELHFIHGDAVNPENGPARIVRRDGSTVIFLCESCGRWTRDAMDHLRRGYRDASAYQQPALSERERVA